MIEKNYIFGIHSVIEAIKAGKTIDKLLIKKGLKSDHYKELQDEVFKYGYPVQFVPENKLNNITQKNHQGVIAFISPIEYQDIEQLIPMLFDAGKIPLLLVLDQITDVRNFGAICRSADCAGVQAILIPSKGAAQINADAIKTSSGALNSLPVCRTNSLYHTCKYIKNCGLQLIGATEKASELYFSVDLSIPTAIVMGSEEYGISNDLLKICDKLVSIPVSGKIASLNVSAAASVLIYEAYRQRIQ